MANIGAVRKILWVGLVSFSLLCPVIAIAQVENAKSQIHNVIDCQIFDMKGETLRRFPGEFCLFLDDGRFLSAQKSKLLLYDQNGRVVWQKDIYPHHQMNLTLDGGSVLVIGSESRINKKSGEQTSASRFRSDVLYQIDLSGKVIKKFRIYDYSQSFPKERWRNALNRRYPLIWSKSTYPGITWEFSHTNSFYEIPDNQLAQRNPAFKKGNFILNDISLMLVFILDSDLKKVLWHSPLIQDEWNMFHDIQVVPGSDRLLVYDNGTPSRKFSRLIEIDPLSGKLYWEYKADPVSKFYMEKRGGIQVLANGNVLFNDFMDGPRGIEIKKDGTIVWQLKPAPQDQESRAFQQIKRYNLSSFLERNKSL